MARRIAKRLAEMKLSKSDQVSLESHLVEGMYDDVLVTVLRPTGRLSQFTVRERRKRVVQSERA